MNKFIMELKQQLLYELDFEYDVECSNYLINLLDWALLGKVDSNIIFWSEIFEELQFAAEFQSNEELNTIADNISKRVLDYYYGKIQLQYE